MTSWDLMRIYGGLMGFNRFMVTSWDLMGFYGDFMGFNGSLW